MILNLQEISINIIIEDYNINLLTFNNLYSKKVFPEHWQLSIQPIENQQETIICFENKISIIIQSGKILLSEFVGNKTRNEIEIGNLAVNLIKKLRQINILSISINPDYYYYLDVNNNINKSIYRQILGSKYCQKSSRENTMSAGIQKIYPYRLGQLALNIYQANVEISEKILTVICFTASFDYRVFPTEKKSKLNHIQQILQNWDEDLNKLQNFIQRKFLYFTMNNHIN